MIPFNDYSGSYSTDAMEVYIKDATGAIEKKPYLKVPIIAIIIGEGGSGGALALAVADKVWMLENTIYSILSPEGFATILWKDGSRSEEAAELMKITSGELLNMGIVDKVIPERGYFTSEIIEAIKTAIVDELAELSQLSTENLLEARYQRFRKY